MGDVSDRRARPIDVNQVVTAATGFGHVARCGGCPWRAVHDTKLSAIVAGQRHVRAAHPATLKRAEPSGESAA